MEVYEAGNSHNSSCNLMISQVKSVRVIIQLYLKNCLPQLIFSFFGAHSSSRMDVIYRGSYMSAHVLLNLLNEFGKRDKMRGLPSILSLFSQRV